MLIAGFFSQNAVARIGGEQCFYDGGLGGLVDLSDEIVGLLDRYADRFNVKRCTVDDGTGGACSLDGHVEHGV